LQLTPRSPVRGQSEWMDANFNKVTNLSNNSLSVTEFYILFDRIYLNSVLNVISFAV
jgi:hypothetical protein